MLDLKRCAKCKKDRPVACFHRHARSSDGLQSYCKDCLKLWKREESERKAKRRQEEKVRLFLHNARMKKQRLEEKKREKELARRNREIERREKPRECPNCGVEKMPSKFHSTKASWCIKCANGLRRAKRKLERQMASELRQRQKPGQNLEPTDRRLVDSVFRVLQKAKEYDEEDRGKPQTGDDDVSDK